MPIEKKRSLNERKFHNWKKLSNGGRKYWFDINGKHGWKARYIKEVNAKEETTKFYQEIYNDRGRLAEIHEKYPIDRGHKKIKEV
jgi:hypothetical protein